MIAPLVPDRGLSEQFSFIHTSLDFSSVGLQNTRTLLITSAGAGEGKSTVAAGLAVSIAKHGKPTILLDADLRRPSLASRFDLHEQQGLTELLLGRAEPADVMTRVGDENLFVIAAGSIPPDPTVLLRSLRFTEVLKSLESLSALVIIDSPPLLPVTDAMLISDIADATALVVDVRKTRRSAVRQASAMLRRGNANVLGVIQNKSKAQNSNYYYYGSYSQHTPTHGLPVRIIKRLAPGRLFAKR
jgi:capsular exopolysaccharide synthesis family protein